MKEQLDWPKQRSRLFILSMILRIATFIGVCCVNVDVPVSHTSGRKDHAMGMKRGAGDGGGLSGRKERRVGRDGIERGAVDVEDS